MHPANTHVIALIGSANRDERVFGKGTGFYSTDHRKPKAKEPPKGGDGK